MERQPAEGIWVEAFVVNLVHILVEPRDLMHCTVREIEVEVGLAKAIRMIRYTATHLRNQARNHFLR